MLSMEIVTFPSMKQSGLTSHSPLVKNKYGTINSPVEVIKEKKTKKKNID